MIFDGTSGQTVVFNEPGVASSSFKDVDMDNAAGVTFTSSAFFTGGLTLLPNAIMNQGGGIFISFTTHLPAISSEATYNVVNTQVSGNITMDLPATLFEPTNNPFVNAGSKLFVNGHQLSIGGDLTVTTSDVAGDGLIMTNVSDEVIVGGNALFTTLSQHTSASSTGNFAEGLLRVRGNFTQTRSGSSASTGSFISTGTKVTFDGTSGQTVVFNQPSVASSSFKDVDMDNAAGVTLTSSVYFTGRLTLLSEALMTRAVGSRASLRSTCPPFRRMRRIMCAPHGYRAS